MTVKFLGNQSSFHLVTWKKLYGSLGIDIQEIGTIHQKLDNFEKQNLIGFQFLPKILRYVILGLYCLIRFTEKNVVFHAHGASGYGLSALLSGRKYIVTVYGSEVLNPQNSQLYKLIVKLVLMRAYSITVTSSITKAYIVEHFKISEKKIHCFHTGIDTDQLDELVIQQMGTPQVLDTAQIKFLSIRNSASHYRTQEIVEAFLKLNNLDKQTHSLTLIQGNGDELYWNELKAKFGEYQNIHFLNGLINHDRFLNLIYTSDVCINFPKTDQLSTTILEALYLKKKLISSDLDAYQELYSEKLQGVVTANNAEELDQAFLKMSITVEISNYHEKIKRDYLFTSAKGSLAKSIEGLLK